MTVEENFKNAVERTVWAHSNLDPTTRAEILRDVALELEMDDTKYARPEKHIEHVLGEVGVDFDWEEIEEWAEESDIDDDILYYDDKPEEDEE